MSGGAFDYVRPADLPEALAVGAMTGSAYLAGGTDLMPLWKVRAEAPARVVDISRLPLDGIAAGASLRLGALAHLSEVAVDASVRPMAPDRGGPQRQRLRPGAEHGHRRRRAAAANPLRLLPQ